MACTVYEERKIKERGSVQFYLGWLFINKYKVAYCV
jgi:hypothetical protein